MTSSDTPPAQNLAVLKGIAAGLGLLLIAGLALLVTLLVTRSGGEGASSLPPVVLRAGEQIASQSLSGEAVLLLITSESRPEASRVVVVDLRTGEQRVIPLIDENAPVTDR